MNVEPAFISQTAEPQTAEQREQWVNKHIHIMRREGATYFRVSEHPTNHHLCLVEGWKAQPLDKGEPRWQFAA
jgi:hypothetical protein